MITMSGFIERMRSAILSKLRVGLSCGITSLASMPIDGSLPCSSLAVPVPNSPDSWTITAVLAMLPAALLRVASVARPSSTQTPKPGFMRKVFFSPRLTIKSEAPTSIRNGVPYFEAAWLAAMPTGLWKQPMYAAAPCSFIFSTSATPTSTFDWLSPSSASSLAPPIDLMPPALFTSSIAIVPPSRLCWPL